jgi:hypothetical protein
MSNKLYQLVGMCFAASMGMACAAEEAPETGIADPWETAASDEAAPIDESSVAVAPRTDRLSISLVKEAAAPTPAARVIESSSGESTSLRSHFDTQSFESSRDRAAWRKALGQ